MVWCGVVWCGVVWCGVVLCGIVRRISSLNAISRREYESFYSQCFFCSVCIFFAYAHANLTMKAFTRGCINHDQISRKPHNAHPIPSHHTTPHHNLNPRNPQSPLWSQKNNSISIRDLVRLYTHPTPTHHIHTAA